MRLRVLLISSVAPTPTGAGQLLLHRHLLEEPRIELGLVLQEPWAGTEPSMIAKPSQFLGRIRNTRLHRYVHTLQDYFHCVVRASPILEFAEQFRPDVVLTVAHGDLYPYALSVATALGKPLASIYHDWWPAMVPAWRQKREEQQFRRLYRASKAAFCISDEMGQEMGRHPNAPVILPVPGKEVFSSTPHPKEERFTIVYAGSLDDVYKGGMSELVEALRGHPRLRLKLLGPAHQWEPRLLDRLKSEGVYHGSHPVGSPPFEAVLDGADALLTHLSFNPVQAIRVRTSFPSKLTDYLRRGKPLVLWGPFESAAATWLKRQQAGSVVDQPSVTAVVSALDALADDASLCRKLSARTQALSRGIVSRDYLQGQFLQGLHVAIDTDH